MTSNWPNKIDANYSLNKKISNFAIWLKKYHKLNNMNESKTSTEFVSGTVKMRKYTTF